MHALYYLEEDIIKQGELSLTIMSTISVNCNTSWHRGRTSEGQLLQLSVIKGLIVLDPDTHYYLAKGLISCSTTLILGYRQRFLWHMYAEMP